MTGARLSIALLVLTAGLGSSCALAQVLTGGLMDGQAGAPVLVPVVFGPGVVGVFVSLVILALGKGPPGDGPPGDGGGSGESP